MAIKQISVFAGNKPGALVSVTEALQKSKIDIRAMSVADTSEFGIIHLIVNKTEQAKEVLTSNCLVSVDDVMAVAIPDKPGAMTEMLKLLSLHNINIEYMYAFLIPTGATACVVLRVNELSTAESLLLDNKFMILSDEDIKNL